MRNLTNWKCVRRPYSNIKASFIGPWENEDFQVGELRAAQHVSHLPTLVKVIHVIVDTGGATEGSFSLSCATT